MVPILFPFPTRKNLSGIGSPTKKARVLIWTKNHFFEDFYIQIFNWKWKESNSNFQVRCAYQTTTNIALLWKIFELEEKATWFPSNRSSFLSKFLLTCSVSGVAWRYALLVKKYHVNGFAPYPPPALWVVSKICLVSKKIAMLVVLLHIPHLLCEWCRWKICLASEKKYHVSCFAPYPHRICEWCRLKICKLSKKCHVSGFAPYPQLLCEWCRLKICVASKKMPCQWFCSISPPDLWVVSLEDMPC